MENRSLPVLVVFLLFCGSSSTITEGIISNKNFAFLGKFCFSAINCSTPVCCAEQGGAWDFEANWCVAGAVQVNFTATAKMVESTTLYFFDDQASSWPLVYHSDLSCAEKLTHARGHANAFTVDPAYPDSWTYLETIHETSRPRFWWVVAANCTSPLTWRSYTLEFVNPFHSQFSTNDAAFLPTAVAGAVLWSLLLAVHLYGHKDWKPAVAQVFTLALSLRLYFLLALSVHWAVFAQDGRGVPPLSGTGRVARWLSKLCTLATMGLFVTGFGITRRTVPTADENRVALGLLAALVLAYVVLFVWYELGRDPASTNYVYDSIPGICVIAVEQLFGLWWLARLRAQLAVLTGALRTFFKCTGAILFLWFLILPCTAFLGSLMDPWVAENVVDVCDQVLHTIVAAGVVYMYWPSRARNHFELAFSEAAYSSLLSHDSL